MHGHPTLGVKNAKPRLSSRPGPKIGKLSEEYLTVRNARMRTKNLTAEMQLAERRGELIEKKLVEQQAAYLLVALRQATLNIPQAYAPSDSQHFRAEASERYFERGNGGTTQHDQGPTECGERPRLARHVGEGRGRVVPNPRLAGC